MKSISSNYNLNVEMFATQGRAAIHFYLPEKSEVLLCVMNAGDKEVRLLINEAMPKGDHSTLFSFGNLEPDEYLIRLLINHEDAVDIETLNIKIQ